MFLLSLKYFLKAINAALLKKCPEMSLQQLTAFGPHKRPAFVNR